MNAGLVESSGLTGQNGRESESIKAVHATPPASRSWQHSDGHAEADSAAQQRRSGRAAHPDADQEDRQDDGKRVDGGAQEQAEQARPDDFGAQRRRAGNGDGDVNRPGPHGGHRRGAWGRLGRLAAGGHRQAGEPDGGVDGRGDQGGHRQIEHAQQIEARQQAAENRARGVAAIEKPEPGDAFRVDSTQRAAAGSDAPIRMVGGMRQMAQITARKRMAGMPWPTAAT